MHADERTDAIVAVMRRVADEGAVVPALWPTEVGNGLQMAVRRKRITVPERDEILASLRRLPIEYDTPPPTGVWGAPVGLAHRHVLTVYDAAYVALALERRLPLATLDEAMRNAARAEGVTVLP